MMSEVIAPLLPVLLYDLWVELAREQSSPVIGFILTDLVGNTQQAKSRIPAVIRQGSDSQPLSKVRKYDYAS